MRAIKGREKLLQLGFTLSLRAGRQSRRVSAAGEADFAEDIALVLDLMQKAQAPQCKKHVHKDWPADQLNMKINTKEGTIVAVREDFLCAFSHYPWSPSYSMALNLRHGQLLKCKRGST